MAKNAKQQAAIAMSMKAAGKKPKMAKGGTMKKYDNGGKVTPNEKTGSDQLPSAVKNTKTRRGLFGRTIETTTTKTDRRDTDNYPISGYDFTRVKKVSDRYGNPLKEKVVTYGETSGGSRELGSRRRLNKGAKGGTTGGTALKNALIKAGYKKGGSVKKKK
jgi:hypothetical protein